MTVKVVKRMGRVIHTYKMRQIGVGEPFDVDVPDVPIMLAAGWIDPEEGEEGYIAPTIKPAQSARRKTAESKAA